MVSSPKNAEHIQNKLTENLPIFSKHQFFNNNKTPNKHLVSELDCGQQCIKVAGLNWLQLGDLGITCVLHGCDVGLTLV